MDYGADLGFTFVHTPKVIFGENALAEVGTLLSDLKASRALLVTDRFLAEKTELVARLRKAAAGRIAGEFLDVVPDPTAESIDRAAELARRVGADAVVSLGGGSAIDTGKGLAVVLTEGGRVLDHEGYHALPKPLVPHLAIPTTAGTGSEMTMVTVITDPARGQKTFIGSYFLHPDVAVLDPTCTRDLPPLLTAATGMDAMAHAVEALFSTLRQPFSDACALAAIRTVMAFLPRSVRDGADLLARGQMLIAAAQAGSAFSNAMVSLNHAMVHSLGARFHKHHGTLNAVLLPHTMRFFAPDVGERFVWVAQAMGVAASPADPVAAGLAAADRMEKLNTEIGLPRRLSELGIPREALAEVAEMALSDGSIIYSPRPIAEAAEVLSVLERAY